METADFLEHIDLPRSLVEDIATHLSDAIFEGKLHPGQPIIETELQRLLGVSRAPLREALLKLEGQGLIKMVPRRGAFVRAITPRWISEIFTVRAWLEGLAARLTVQRADPSCCKRLEEIVADMGRLAQQKRFKAYFYRHWDFHRVFSEGSGNAELCERIASMRRESLWLSYSITYFEHNHQASQKTHRRIADLFRQGDPEEVEQAVRVHILDAIDQYVQFLKETYPNLAVTG
jgi:DNA-binding GntR family transcriptional regulator